MYLQTLLNVLLNEIHCVKCIYSSIENFEIFLILNFVSYSLNVELQKNPGIIVGAGKWFNKMWPSLV